MLTSDIPKLIDIVTQAARKELLPRFTHVTHDIKNDGSIVTEADIATQQSLSNSLLHTWPNTRFLGEEMSAEEQLNILKSDSPVWCLDPLDGTSNFAAGIPYFAVSLSLIRQGEVILGLVFDPIRDELFLAEKLNSTLSVTFNQQVLKINSTRNSLDKSMAIIDFKRLDKNLASRLATDQPFASQRNFGASALDWCWLALSRGHLYLHGKQNLWDYAAGEMIFKAAGGYACTLNGEKIYQKSLEKRSVVAAVNEKLFNDWRAWINQKN